MSFSEYDTMNEIFEYGFPYVQMNPSILAWLFGDMLLYYGS